MNIGTLKDIKDTAKDLLENRVNKKDFENIIDKLYFELENDLTDNLLDEKYRKLEELSLKINLNKLDDNIIKKYKKIKAYYNEQDKPAFLFDLY